MSPPAEDLCESAVTSCDQDSKTRIEELLIKKSPVPNANLWRSCWGLFCFSDFDTTLSFSKSKNRDWNHFSGINRCWALFWNVCEFWRWLRPDGRLMQTSKDFCLVLFFCSPWPDCNVFLALYFLSPGKNRRLKQAKEEAQAEIEQYRLQREKEFKTKEAAVCQLNHSHWCWRKISTAWGRDGRVVAQVLHKIVHLRCQIRKPVREEEPSAAFQRGLNYRVKKVCCFLNIDCQWCPKVF